MFWSKELDTLNKTTDLSEVQKYALRCWYKDDQKGKAIAYEDLMTDFAFDEVRQAALYLDAYEKIYEKRRTVKIIVVTILTLGLGLYFLGKYNRKLCDTYNEAYEYGRKSFAYDTYTYCNEHGDTVVAKISDDETGEAKYLTANVVSEIGPDTNTDLMN